MRERQPGDRLRVVIAGNIYATHAVVRRFLEDDGFDVAAEALTLPDLLATPDLDRADAVVIDGDLLNGTIERLRAVAPDAALVVVTDRAAARPTGPAGADAYLEKGSGLASLTALLHSLLSEAPPSPLIRESTEPRSPAQERRVLAGLAGIGGAVVLIAVLALAVFGGAPVPTPSPTPNRSPGTAVTSGPSAVELAMADLHRLHDALEQGRDVEAQWLLDRLQGELASARNAGFSISGLRAVATQLFRPLLGDVAPRLFDDLRSLPGGFLAFLITAGSPTGSAALIGASTTDTTSSQVTLGTSPVASTSDTTGGAVIGTSGTGTGGGSTGEGGGGSTGGGGGGSTGGGGGGSTGGGGGTIDLTIAISTMSPGNGRHYGWAHKPPSGGWHGTKPHPSLGDSAAGAAQPGAPGRDRAK